MATSFKAFLDNDRTTTRTLLHEAIPVTGTIVSGTYNNENVKNYAHGMFQSVYDYPYLSSSANHIFDLAVGYSTGSKLSSSANTDNAKKINIYNQMAQLLMGHDEDGNIRLFDEDGDLTGGTVMNEVVFINFSRLLHKDEIKKGSFVLTLLSHSQTTAGGAACPEISGSNWEQKTILEDYNATNDYRTNSPAGEYGILYADVDARQRTAATKTVDRRGLIFYQAGVAVVTASAFHSGSTWIGLNGAHATQMLSTSPFGAPGATYDTGSIAAVLSASAISSSCDGVRNMLHSVQFNNTTELNSSIYFCRVNHNDYNYSSNPTYLSSSKMQVKNKSSDSPVSYVTTIGLYSADNDLLAVAKLSEPLKKDPTTEFTLRVRLDY